MKRDVQSFSCSSSRALVDGYLEELKEVRGLSPHTIRAYGCDLSAFLAWCERTSRDPLTLDVRELRSWLAELRQAHYSPRTTNRKLSSLRGFYSWLSERGLASQAAVLTQSGPKTGRHLPKVMSNADVERLLAAADGEEGTWRLFDLALIEFLYASGARIQEVSNLNVGDVDFSRGQARLFGKGSKERLVPLYPKALEALLTYLKVVRPMRAARTAPSNIEANDAIFLSTRGNRMSAQALRRRVKALVALSGVSVSVSPHTFRHTYATELLNGDADLRSVQELLGHASLSTTQVYTNLSVERLRDVMDRAHPRGKDSYSYD